MSEIKKLKDCIAVFDYYLVDYAHPVNWTKFRESLRYTREILVGVLKDEINRKELMDEHLKNQEEKAVDWNNPKCPMCGHIEFKPNELVNKIMTVVSKYSYYLCFTHSEAKAEIRKLLGDRFNL